jgi:putative ABC transport system permease protein
MKMAARELLRRPRSFFVPVGILLLLALLLLYPSAILDGILEDTSAAIHNAPADLIVYSHEANGVILRSRLDPGTQAQVATVEGVAQVASFDVILFAGRVQGLEGSIGLAVQASDQPLQGVVPAPGEALADVSLREKGVEEGSQIAIGPLQTPVTVSGFTEGRNLWFANGLVVDKSTWLATLGQTAPSADVGSGTQALLVTAEADADLNALATAVDEATSGTTQSLTRADAVRAMPGVEQQESTFGYIRLVTLTVALVVVGLFLSFMTLERAPLYAVLKAVGASSRQLFVVLMVQVLMITIVAVTAAAGVTYLLTLIPFELPTTMRPERLIETLVALSLTAVIGSTLSLRKVVRVDPADAIG